MFVCLFVFYLFIYAFGHIPTTAMSAAVQPHGTCCKDNMHTTNIPTFPWLKKTKAQAAGLHRLGVGTPHSGFSPFSLVVAVGRTTRYEPKRGSFLTQWTCADDAKWLQLRTGGRWWASPVWSATQDPVPHSVLPPMPSSPSLPVFIDIGLSSQASLYTGPSSARTSPVASA